MDILLVLLQENLAALNPSGCVEHNSMNKCDYMHKCQLRFSVITCGAHVVCICGALACVICLFVCL